MIRIHELSKKFGKLQALSQVSLQCNKGESIALIGPNGCGKTTLIKSILSMVIPDSGSIEFEGQNIQRDFVYRENIGYMPQIGRYPDNMSIGQVLETIQQLRGVGKATDLDLYEAYGLKELLHKRMSTLSGGTRQKVSAVMAFMFDPKVLILDEPTAGLDPIAAEILKEKIIAERQKNKLILITSHLLHELEEIISEIIFMQDGVVHFHDSTVELKLKTAETSISKAVSKVLKGGLL